MMLGCHMISSEQTEAFAVSASFPCLTICVWKQPLCENGKDTGRKRLTCRGSGKSNKANKKKKCKCCHFQLHLPLHRSQSITEGVITCGVTGITGWCAFQVFPLCPHHQACPTSSLTPGFALDPDLIQAQVAQTIWQKTCSFRSTVRGLADFSLTSQY